MRIDAHQHFWSYDSRRHQWIDDTMREIQRDFGPSHLIPHLKQHSIDGSVAVQVDQTEEENHYLLELAIGSGIIRGIVGWVDLLSPRVEERLAYYSEYPIIKGFRHIVQSEPDQGFMLRSDFMDGISRLGAFDYTYDILIFPNQLGAAIDLVSRFPDQKFVLDHIAKPYIRTGKLEAWKSQIRELGTYENVWCKVSGMVTEADWKNWSKEDIYPYLDEVVDAFGTDRLLYGSDWPVCTVAASYSEVYRLVEAYWAQFSDREEHLFFGETAANFYNL